MKKLILSGFGLMMVLMIAMPAAAEKGTRQHKESYSGSRHSKTYSSKNQNRQTVRRDVKDERRGYQREMKDNARTLRQADSQRERAKIRSNMRGDSRDYKHEVRRIKRDYHAQQHSYHQKRVVEDHRKGHTDKRYFGRNRVLGVNHLGWGFWF